MPKDLRKIETADVANRTIVPHRVGGVLRTGKQDIPLNRAYQRFGTAKTMQQFANRYMNEGGTSPLFGANEKISGGQLPDLPPEISEPIQKVFDRLPGMTPIEQEAVFRFLFQEIVAGNWGLTDEFYCFSLSGANASQGWIAKTGSTTNSFDVTGMLCTGVSGFATNWNPTADGVNYISGSCATSMYIHTIGTQLQTPAMMCEGVPNRAISLRTLNAPPTGYNYSSEGNLKQSGSAPEAGPHLVRLANGNDRLFVDNRQIANQAADVNGDFNQDVWVGSREGNDFPFVGAISTIGFLSSNIDQDAHNINLKRLMQDLGAIPPNRNVQT